MRRVMDSGKLLLVLDLDHTLLNSTRLTDVRAHTPSPCTVLPKATKMHQVCVTDMLLRSRVPAQAKHECMSPHHAACICVG